MHDALYIGIDNRLPYVNLPQYIGILMNFAKIGRTCKVYHAFNHVISYSRNHYWLREKQKAAYKENIAFLLSFSDVSLSRCNIYTGQRLEFEMIDLIRFITIIHCDWHTLSVSLFCAASSVYLHCYKWYHNIMFIIGAYN